MEGDEESEEADGSGVLDRDAFDRGENDATGGGVLPSHFAVIEQGAAPTVSEENLEIRTGHRGVGADSQVNAEKLCETPSKSRASGSSEDRFDGEFRHTRLPRADAKALDDNSVARLVGGAERSICASSPGHDGGDPVLTNSRGVDRSFGSSGGEGEPHFCNSRNKRR